MLRNSVIYKLTRMRNNGLLQTTDRGQWFLLCVFEAGFEDVPKDVQSLNKSKNTVKTPFNKLV